MSTRANIIIKDSYSHLFFYRHSDGYPDGVKPSLDKFCELLKEGKIRNNVSQGAGHLILIGMAEYNNAPTFEVETDKGTSTGVGYGKIATYEPAKEKYNPACTEWKVGAYEPTTGLHGDIEHLYVVDLQTMEWNEIPSSEWSDWAQD